MKHILVIEDEEDILTIIKATLEQKGYTVTVAKDAESALEILKKEIPHLIILDVMLTGGMNGYKVCKQLKEDVTFKHIPIIILSARGRKEEVELAYRVKADHFILKPFDPKNLLQKVAQLIGE